MQSYQLDLLDEKALVILRGLEQLRIITLRPLNTANDEKKVNDYDSTEQQHDIVQEPSPDNRLSNFKKFQGSIDLNLTRNEIDIEIEKSREGWL